MATSSFLKLTFLQFPWPHSILVFLLPHWLPFFYLLCQLLLLLMTSSENPDYASDSFLSFLIYSNGLKWHPCAVTPHFFSWFWLHQPLDSSITWHLYFAFCDQPTKPCSSSWMCSCHVLVAATRKAWDRLAPSTTHALTCTVSMVCVLMYLYDLYPLFRSQLKLSSIFQFRTKGQRSGPPEHLPWFEIICLFIFVYLFRQIHVSLKATSVRTGSVLLTTRSCNSADTWRIQ